MELFLEKSYRATTVEQIASRAGISRASFFNYLPTKSDVLWIEVDEALNSLGNFKKTYLSVGLALEASANACQLERIPLAVTQKETMGLTSELSDTAGPRILRLVNFLQSSGMDHKDSWLVAGVIIGALLGWLEEPTPRGDLADRLRTSFLSIEDGLSKQSAALLL